MTDISPKPVPPTPQRGMQDLSQRLALARARATAADAWRAHVEALALIHRQRAAALERQIGRLRGNTARLQADIDVVNSHMAELQRLADAAFQRADALQVRADRLQYHVEDLNGVLRERDAQVHELLERPSIAYAVKQTLRRSLVGSVLRRLKGLAARGRPVDVRGDVPDAGTDAGTGDAVAEEPATAPEPSLTPAVAPGAAGDASTAVVAPASFQYECLDPERPVLLFITACTDNSAVGRHTAGLAEALASYANVLVWHLGDAPLPTQLRQRVTASIACPEARHDYERARQILAEFCGNDHRIDYALVVGKECKSVLPALAAQGIPTLTLVHDEDAYAHSVYFWQEILFWSTHTCFTTAAAREQVLKICSYLNPDRVSVLASGAGAPVSDDTVALAPDPAAALWGHRVHSSDISRADTVVLGWGAADYLSGLDLFVACAAVIKHRFPERHIRFVWLAQDDEAGDTSFPFAIKQQIARMGLSDRVAVLDAAFPLDVVLSRAAMLLFPARSDVLRHCTVEAMRSGLPVLAFDGATATSHALEKQGFAADSVVSYGDVNALAERVATLSQNDEARADLGRRLSQADWTAITLDGSAQLVMERCVRLQHEVAQEQRDEAVILASEQLRPDYMGEIVHHTGMQACTDARLYIKGWKVGLGARKPRPGLHPGIYAAARVEADPLEDPFAAFLRDASPSGPWQYPTIGSAKARISDADEPCRASDTSIALHVHAYYPEMLAEILARIRLNSCRPDLFVSVRDEQAQTLVREMLEGYEGRLVSVDVVPNRGRDIGPFLTTYGTLLARDYDLIGHVHTKRSSHADREVVELWRNFLLGNLLGSDYAGPMMDNILDQMARHPDWGIAFPDDPVPLGWDGNLVCAEELASRMQVDELPPHFSFPAGTMFWMRAAALRPFVDLDLAYDDYPLEPLPIDGTLLHALERLFGVIPRAKGMECALVSVPGLSR